MFYSLKYDSLMKNSNQNDIHLMVFENPEFGHIRTMTDENGEPLFCGKDVCEALGYRKADIAVKQHVSIHDVTKRYVRVGCGKKTDGSLAMKSILMLFVNESGLYSLIFGSKLDTAQRFKHWVTSEVLPAIRKNGCYISLLQKKSAEIVSLENYIDQLLPKALYADNVLDSISCYTTTQIAKELGITAQELNRTLCALHIQYYQSGQYLLYADFAHMGLAKSRTKVENVMCEVTEDGFKHGRTYTHTYLVWTERGRKFIHQLAKRYWELAKMYRTK